MSRLNRPAFFAFSAIGGYLNDLWPDQRKLLDHLPNRAHLGDRFSALRTPFHWRLYPPVDPGRLPAVGSLMPFIATR